MIGQFLVGRPLLHGRCHDHPQSILFRKHWCLSELLANHKVTSLLTVQVSSNMRSGNVERIGSTCRFHLLWMADDRGARGPYRPWLEGKMPQKDAYFKTRLDTHLRSLEGALNKLRSL